jgi:hypothetical protein
LGVSMMTWILLWNSLSNGARRVGSARTPRGLIFFGIGQSLWTNHKLGFKVSTILQAGFAGISARQHKIVPGTLRAVDTVKGVLSPGT